ncbi:MAG: hypothetical protein D6812_00430 [Deltaproteobacteria bacterium]|nr:MAG: hypothetical protein D6812_00430 [Deltaproteobacteria bacterium]
MRKLAKFCALALLVAFLGWSLVSACASPTQIFSTPLPLFEQPSGIVSFPKALIESVEPVEDTGEESAGTEETPLPSDFIVYVLDRRNGEGVIDVLEMSYTGRGTLASSIVSIEDPDASGDITNEIPLGGFLEDAVIDTTLKLCYVVTTSPPALHVIDIENHRRIDFVRVRGSSEETLQFLDLPGLPAGIAVLPAPGSESSHPSRLYLSDQSNGDLLIFDVTRDETGVRISGGDRRVSASGSEAGIVHIGGAPGRIRRLPTPVLPKVELGGVFFVADRAQRKFTLVEESFPPLRPERIVRDVPLPTASRDFIVSSDLRRLFVLPFGAHRVSIFDLSPDPPILLRQKITLCSLPLSGIVQTDAETQQDTLFVTTDQNRVVTIDVPREDEPLSGGDAQELLLPEVRCDGGEAAGGITLESQDNIIRADPRCPVFTDLGVHSGPHIDFIILDTCVTPSLDWDFIFDQFVDENGTVQGSYIVFSRPLGSGIENRRAQPRRLPEISPQELAENPNGGFYTTSNGELTTRVIFEPSPSGVSNTSDGDHFSFSTFAGFRAVEIGLLPVQAIVDPEETFGIVVNQGGNSLTIFRLDTLDILSEIR